MRTYYRLKAHVLALPSCGISTCTQVPLAKRKEMEREAFVGAANVASKTKQNKNDDPLPFLRKSSNKFPFESSSGRQAVKKYNSSFKCSGKTTSEQQIPIVEICDKRARAK